MKELDDEPDALWHDVQRALDERRDPREDPRVLEALVLEPERLRELEILLERIGRIRVPTRPRFARRAAAIAAILISAAAFAIIWHLRETRSAMVRTPAPNERVISFEFELTSETPERRSSILLTERGVRSTCDFLADPATLSTWTNETSSTYRP